MTGVSVIGMLNEDYAIYVHFDDLEQDFWISNDLVEVIDHSSGTVVSVDGQETEWVRLADGEWQEHPKPQ